jgi:hypothetical protein
MKIGNCAYSKRGRSAAWQVLPRIAAHERSATPWPGEASFLHGAEPAPTTLLLRVPRVMNQTPVVCWDWHVPESCARERKERYAETRF